MQAKNDEISNTLFTKLLAGNEKLMYGIAAVPVAFQPSCPIASGSDRIRALELSAGRQVCCMLDIELCQTRVGQLVIPTKPMVGRFQRQEDPLILSECVNFIP